MDCPVYGTERCWCDRDRASLCPDHSQHSDQLILYPQEGTSHYDDDLSTENVTTINVATEEDECEWFGVCSLKYIERLKDFSVVTEDANGNRFIVPRDAVISYG